MKKRIAVSLILLPSAVCFAQSAPQPSLQRAPQTIGQSQPQRNNGSLLRASMSAAQDSQRAKVADVSFFTVPEPKPKLLQKHDLVTIIIRQESSFSAKSNAEFKKQADLDARIEEFIKLKLSNWQVTGGGIGANAPAVSYNAARNFKGEGTVDRSDSMTARVTAEVVDVKPNGTLVIQAKARVVNDEEEQEIILSGICAATEITPDNTILSTQLADLDITKRTKGGLKDTAKRGWVPKLLDVINPF